MFEVRHTARPVFFRLALLALLAVPATLPAQDSAGRFPGDDWMLYVDASEAGFDPAKLAAARETWESLPSSAFMVVVDGAAVAAWGDVGRRFMCHSVRKSFLSALYGIYWDRGEIELNKTLADLGIDDEPDPLLDTEKQARILDLLKARSGVFHPAAYAGRTDSRPRGSEGPGRYFAYNNWDFNTLAAILREETGADLFEAFDEYFGRPLQMEDWRVSDGYYHYERDKSMWPAYPFRMSARDAARFGLLFARDGMWDGERILSSQWVQRSSALYSIDNERMGYGLMWWIILDDRLEPYGAYAALGVGNQMIAVIPKLDMVIVNRADTYVGEATPALALLDLMAQVIDARTGPPDPDAALEPLVVPADPALTDAPRDRLTGFVGTWDYPAPPLGLPAFTTVDLTARDGHLEAYSPQNGTFGLYLQEDGTLYEEDSQRTYIPIPDGEGAFGGIADPASVVTAAIGASSDGDPERAAELLAYVEGQDSPDVEVGRAVVDLTNGNAEAAERRVRKLVDEIDPAQVEIEVNNAGYGLMRAGRAREAARVFELNTEVFPESWNTWDSLGEALMEAGDTEAAIANYERSLQLNPNNANAVEMISRMRGGETE